MKNISTSKLAPPLYVSPNFTTRVFGANFLTVVVLFFPFYQRYFNFYVGVFIIHCKRYNCQSFAGEVLLYVANFFFLEE